MQIDYDREDADSRGFSQQIGGSYTDQSIEIAHNNDVHALAHKGFIMMILTGMAVYRLMFLQFLIPVQLMHYLNLRNVMYL